MSKSIVQLAATFTIQSYFDNVLLQNAILPAGVGNPIIDSTRQYAQNPGFGVALHPASKSPVAIKFHGGDADTAVVHLTPGQKIMTTGEFKGFDWGLPFGWLGGGAVQLYVLGKGADVEFPDAMSPILFHRMRLQIVNGSGPPAIPGNPNWPLAFPWSNAIRKFGALTVPQPASPLFQLTPDVTIVRYGPAGTALAASLDLNIAFVNIGVLDMNSPPDQAAGYGATTGQISWFPITIPFAPGPNIASLVWLQPEVGHFAGDQAAVTFYDPASGVGGNYIDVARYGKFM